MSSGVGEHVAEGTTNRFDRRKARSRAALIRAAQTFLADGRTAVAVQEVTEAADVGLGTFYNHFASKDELFDAAVLAALEQLGDELDREGQDLDDPAEVFARSFRRIGRLNRTHPLLSQVVLGQGARVAQAPVGLAPRARRDLDAGRAQGRFAFEDLDAVMVVVTGSVLALGGLLQADPTRDAADVTDAVAEHVLVVLGMTRADAQEVVRRPLPDLTPPAGSSGSPARP